MSNPAGDRAERILDAVTGWPGIATAAGEYGETEFLVNGRSIGHLHAGPQADSPVPPISSPTPAGPGGTSGPMPMPPRRSSCSGSTTTASRNEPRPDRAGTAPSSAGSLPSPLHSRRAGGGDVAKDARRSGSQLDRL